MKEPLQIQDVMKLKEFDPVIDLRWVQKKEKVQKLRANYVITEELANLYCDVLGTFSGTPSSRFLEGRPIFSARSSMLTASMGKGKSYFLLFLYEIIKSLTDKDDLLRLEKRFASYPFIIDQIKLLADKKYLIIILPLHHWTETDLTTNVVREIEKTLKNEMNELTTFQTIYGQARFTLEKILREKKAIAEAWEESLQTQGLTVQKLIKNLENQKYSALTIFNKTFTEITGLSANLYQELHLEKIIPELEEKGIEGGFDGVVFLIDELTAYLKVASDFGRFNSDLIKLQTFAEQVNASQIISMVVSQHSALDIFKEKFGSEKEMERVSARFNNLPNILGTDFSEIAKSLFNRGPKFEEFKNDLKIIELLLPLNKDLRKQHMKVDQLDLFPFHSSVIKTIPNISGLMQQERTSSTYIRNTFQTMKNQQVLINDRLNLAMLSSVYDFFLESESSGLITESAHQIIDRLLVIQYPKNQKLKDKVVKSLAIIERSKGAFPYPTSSAVMAHCLMETEEDINNVFEFLTRASSQVYFDVQAGGCGIEKQIVPREEIEKKLDEIKETIDPYKVLMEELIDIQTTEEIIMNVPRTAKIRWTVIESPDMMKKFVAGQPRGVDAVVTYIIPEFTVNYDAQKFNEVAKSLAVGKNIVAIPQHLRFLDRENIAQSKALDSLKNRSDFLEYRPIIEGWWNQLQVEISNIIDHFLHPETFQFFSEEFSEPQYPEIQSTDFKGLFKKFLENRFPQFPWDMSDIRNRGASNKIIDNFIEHGKVPFDDSMDGELKKHLDNTMRALKLVEIKEDEAFFVDPSLSGSDVPEIWNEICNWVDDQSLETPFSKLYKTLNDPPFGLSIHLIEILIISALKLGKFRIHAKAAKFEKAKKSDLAKEITKHKDSGYEKKNVWNPTPNERILINQISNLLLESGSIIDTRFGPDEQNKAWRDLTKDLSKSLIIWNSNINFMMNISAEDIDEEDKRELEDITGILKTIDSSIKIKDHVDGFTALISICGVELTEEEKTKEFWKIAEKIENVKGIIESKDFLHDVVSKFKNNVTKSFIENSINYCTNEKIRNEMINSNEEIQTSLIKPLNWIKSKQIKDEIRFEIEETLRKAIIIYADVHNKINSEKQKIIADITDHSSWNIILAVKNHPLPGIITPKSLIKKHLELNQSICEIKIDPPLTGRIEITPFVCSKCTIPLENLVSGEKSELDEMTKLKNQTYGVLAQYLKLIIDNAGELSEDVSIKNDKFKNFTETCESILINKKITKDDSRQLVELLPIIIPQLIEFLRPSGPGPDVDLRIDLSQFLKEFRNQALSLGKTEISVSQLVKLFDKFSKDKYFSHLIELTS